MIKRLKSLIMPKHLEKGVSTNRLATSISDNARYPQFCLDAANNYALFDNFRKNPTYKEILEHVNQDQGMKYLQLVTDKKIIERFPDFKKNDLCGNPEVYDYPGIGSLSPTTARYIKVLQDLKTEFKNLNGKSICEIGVGYGGQCRIINSFFAPRKYALVDIKPALQLAQRYLDHFPLRTELEYKTMNEMSLIENFDIVISNYAFTELPRSIQEIYFEKIIDKSKHGYITYNEISPASFESYNREEILGRIKGSRAKEEIPVTHPKNCIIVW
ncbi:MAG: putative sugar O-methyltransferase [Turneriella sp.]|nr:putative sugar O-methyltransferase [Turneriella sp.]